MPGPARTLRAALAVLAGAAVLLAAAACGPRLGVHQDLTYQGRASERERAVDLAARRLGAQVSRSGLLWSQVEARRGARDWERADSVVDAVSQAGMTPLLYLATSPAWANGSNDPFAVPTDAAQFAAWRTAFVDFARAAARRYAGRVRHWEVWNEPNEAGFWRPAPPDARRYGELFRAVRAAILEEDPGARVAIGGLAGLNAGGGVPGKRFLDQLVDAGVPFDAVALHPYPSEGRGPDERDPYLDNFDDVRDVHERLERRGRRGVELWITEWGWSSAEVGDERQAAYVRRSLERITSEWSGFVTLAVVFLDHDRVGPGDTYRQGLADADLRLKPAGVAFADVARRARRSRAAAPARAAGPFGVVLTALDRLLRAGTPRAGGRR